MMLAPARYLNQVNSMEFLGLIKEHESINRGVKSFKEFNFTISPYKDEILKYLKNGESIAVTMNMVESLYDGDNNIIGGLTYLSDGKWIWTNYLIYYLEKFDIEITDEFVEYVLNKKNMQSEKNFNKQNAIKYLNEKKIVPR